MKNLLLASTALVAFAGAAAAEVAISGSGRMGVVYDSFDQNGTRLIDDEGDFDSGIRFSSRVRVAFTLTQETDSGVTFGGSVRADNASAGNIGEGGSVFMSGQFGKLSMGDVDGAAESAVGNLDGVGYTGLGDFNEAFYLQQGNSDLDTNESLNVFPLPGALYEYSSNGFTGYIGLGNPAGQDFTTDFFDGINTDVSDIRLDNSFGLGAKYAVDNWWVGAGYEQVQISGTVTELGINGVLDGTSEDAGPDGLDNTADDILAGGPGGSAADDVISEFDTDIDNWILGGGVTFDAFTFEGQYGQASGDYLDLTQYGVSGSYTFDAFTVTAFVRQVDLETQDGASSVSRTPYGLGATYDLGGGASVQGGIVDPDIEGEPYRADLGVNFTF